MGYTNSTPNYELPQWIGTDKPTFLGDFNNAFNKIDTQMKANADASTAATATANSAAATATSANTNASTALNTANSAASEAASATSAAASATSTANTASTDAAAALRASAANTIENLAPAYDPTLTYAVGDLVTFIDDQNSGKLYKCIVAVSSPEAFNINKWDDVTTSEAYDRIPVVLNTYTVSENDTLADVFNALFSGVNIENGKEYRVEVIDTTSTNILLGQVSNINGTVRFSQVTYSLGSTSFDILIFIASNNNNSTIRRMLVADNGTITTSNYSGQLAVTGASYKLLSSSL